MIYFYLTVEKLKRLVELESEYGVEPPNTPAIDEILTFMRQVSTNSLSLQNVAETNS